MNVPHLTYAHSPLTHALIAVTYAKPSESTVSQADLSALLIRVFAQAFPDAGYELVDNSGDEQFKETIMLAAKDEKTVIYVTPTYCGALRLKPYESWSKFRPVFDRLWQTVREQSAVSEVHVLGMRYTNQFSLADEDQVSDWLSVYQVHPPLFGETSKDTTSVIRFEDSDTNFDVTVNDEISDGERRVILDFNTRWKTEPLQRFGLSLDEPLEYLHRRIDEAFDNSITPETLEKIRA